MSVEEHNTVEVESRRGSDFRRDCEDADVVVVGAGPSGAVTTKWLVEAGFRVVCLEQGDWPDYSTARATELDFEMSMGKAWAWNPNMRQMPSDYPIEDSDTDVQALMWNGVGGSSLLYACAWHRNLPSDFRVRSLDGVADDWPLSYEELEPYYQRVEREFGVSGHDNDPAFPPGFTFEMPAAPIGRIGELVSSAHNDLGWHWWPGSNAIATKPYRRLKPCVQRAACFWGCVDAAKASVDRTHWPEAIEKGAVLVTGARVTNIELGDDSLVRGVRYVDRDGQEHLQRADVTVIAANGVGTPRLLLNSDTPQHPDGLANSSGLVGKRLMMHPFGAVVGLFDEPTYSWQGVRGQLGYSFEFYETEESRGFVRGAKWQLQLAGGPLGTTRAFPYGEEPIWGERFHDEVARRFGHSAVWGIIAEDLPEESNRVVLDPELKDSDGVPAPKLLYHTTGNTSRLFEFHTKRAKESLEAAGAYEVIVGPPIRETGWHLLGTTKMGDDPTDSVVNRWGRTHDVPNLYVFDGSTWPTSAGVNPTGTIMALALRNTDHLISERNNQEVPA